MTLDIGNVERIGDPSPEQVRHFLRFMPPAAPFVILSTSESSFMQAAPKGEQYRVEYREGKRHYFADVSFEQAVQLFEAFRNNDASFQQAVSWRRLSMLNATQHPAVLTLLGLLLMALILTAAWLALEFWREARAVWSQA